MDGQIASERVFITQAHTDAHYDPALTQLSYLSKYCILIAAADTFLQRRLDLVAHPLSS